MKDPEFELSVEALSEALAPIQLSFAIGFPEVVFEALAEVFDAFATPEPGYVSRAIRGLVA